ncbi:hypothetical protein BUALT_Bualt10G0050800 [Buddleja alternifolia]|uniref:Dynamin stalk domain-containing protein n=1 Tax=Buddleja alternifolia TaxID=168488 RepID=A0AAV6WXA4_9LAMI|nr:hypothetical protein BUALT_Bualt10G0050800 [Buddleja alternifolia]
MVGIPVLAQKLVQIQANIILKCLPQIVRKINDKLSTNMEDLNRILEEDSCERSKENDTKTNLLLDEIRVLAETKSIGLPKFLPRAAFVNLLQKKIKLIHTTPFAFVEKIWSYIEKVLVSVLTSHCENYPQLLFSMTRAARDVVAKKKKASVDWVMNMLDIFVLRVDGWEPMIMNLTIQYRVRPQKVAINILPEAVFAYFHALVYLSSFSTFVIKSATEKKQEKMHEKFKLNDAYQIVLA